MSNLHSYFKLNPVSPAKHTTYFVYTPYHFKAEFMCIPPSNSKFITEMCNIKLYLNDVPNNEFEIPIIQFPKLETHAPYPLLKSNLQKSVRRMRVDIAIPTLLCMLQQNPMDTLRRLPIICVEDVCPTNAFPVLVWLMIALSKKYVLQTIDIYAILQIFNHICHCDASHVPDYDNYSDKDINQNWTHAELERLPNSHLCLALWYRKTYGGMNGDMDLLLRAIMFHSQNGTQGVCEVDWYRNLTVRHVVDILPESVDFHPFPHMLKSVAKQAKVSEQEVKKCVWEALSGVNVRKPFTIENSKNAMQQAVWKKIKVSVLEFQSQYIFYTLEDLKWDKST